jgi:hypothetical protein
MAAPRPAVNGSTLSVGFTTKLVTIQSISPDGKTAICTDRQNTQVAVPMLVQRSKGVLPAAGETWLVTQDLGQWTFAAIAAQSPDQFQTVAQSSGVYTGAEAPGTPSVGELWVNSSLGNIVTVWNGTNWEPLQFGAVAIQPGSLTGKQLAEEANIAASQVNFTATDIGGVTTTISATQPSNPSFNDLWYDAENGYQLNQWSGTQWIPFQFGTQAISARSVTTELLAAEAVTAQQMAAGIIYGGIINGTIVDAATFIGSTFEGTDFIINSAGAYFYTTTPGLGDLVVSITAANGTDPEGNPTQGGLAVYQGSAHIQMHVNNNVGAPAIEMLTGVASEAGGGAIYTWVPHPGAVDEQLVSFWQGPSSNRDNKSVAVEMNSSAADNSALAFGSLNADSVVTAVWDSTGFRASSPWVNMTLQNGWSLHTGSVARYRVGLDNMVHLHFTNVAPGTFADNTVIWNIPAGLRPASAATQNIPAAVDYTAGTFGSTVFVAIRSTTMTIQNLRGTPASISFVASYFLD